MLTRTAFTTRLKSQKKLTSSSATMLKIAQVWSRTRAPRLSSTRGRVAPLLFGGPLAVSLSLTRQRAPGPPLVKGSLRRFAPLTSSSPGHRRP